MKTRRAAAVAAAESSSDDDAPEEVTLEQGKQTATEARSRQRQVVTEQRRQAKEKRRLQANRAEEQAAERRAEQEAYAEAQQGTDAGPGDDVEADLLPDHVIAALAEKARANTAAAAQDSAAAPSATQQQPQAQPRPKRQRLLVREAGPVVVQVLDSVGAQGRLSESAQRFAKERLFGAHKRCETMLQRPSLGACGPAVKFA